MKNLPYRATTATGTNLDFEFPLHRDTGDPVRVGQMISAMLEAIDREIALVGDASNGDVLQAVAMTLAIRARMIHGSQDIAARMAAELVQTAIIAAEDAEVSGPQAGHA